MSGKVVGLVFRKRIGGSAMKAVLAFCAERADDAGKGIWVSKPTMAAGIEMDRATVYRAVAALVTAGLLKPVGARYHPNGETVEYDIGLDVLAALPDAVTAVDAPATRRTARPVAQRDVAPCDPSHSATPPVAQCDPKTSHSATQTVLEPSLNRQRADAARDVRAALVAVVSEQVADDFIAHRQAKRAKLTVRAAELIAQKLSGRPDADAIVNHSIAQGWTGVFPDSVRPAGKAPPARAAPAIGDEVVTADGTVMQWRGAIDQWVEVRR